MANILFLIIDMQNGIINNFTEDLIPKILDFQAKIGDSVLTAGTRYVNHEHTACYMFEGWKSAVWRERRKRRPCLHSADAWQKYLTRTSTAAGMKR